jgi:hypothetical protein
MQLSVENIVCRQHLSRLQPPKSFLNRRLTGAVKRVPIRSFLSWWRRIVPQFTTLCGSLLIFRWFGGGVVLENA